VVSDVFTCSGGGKFIFDLVYALAPRYNNSQYYTILYYYYNIKLLPLQLLTVVIIDNISVSIPVLLYTIDASVSGFCAYGCEKGMCVQK